MNNMGLAARIQNYRTPKRTKLAQSDRFKKTHFLNQQTDAQIEDLMHLVNYQILWPMLPLLEGKKVLLTGKSIGSLWFDKIQEKKPETLVYYGSEDRNLSLPENVMAIRGHAKLLPLKEKSQDVIVSTQLHFESGFIASQVELSRAVANRGSFVCSFPHSCLRMMMTNQNPHSGHVVSNLVQDLCDRLRLEGLFIDKIGEGLVDPAARDFFLEQGQDHYDDFAGVPLTMTIRFVKYTD